MIQTKRWLPSVLFFMLLTSCLESSIKLVDEYRVYSQDEFGSGHYLICKLGCDDDPKIENIESVQWNNQFIVIQKKSIADQKKVWYIIKAKADELKCCNGDVTIGPLTQKEMTDYLLKEDVQNLEEKHF